MAKHSYNNQENNSKKKGGFNTRTKTVNFKKTKKFDTKSDGYFKGNKKIHKQENFNAKKDSFFIKSKEVSNPAKKQFPAGNSFKVNRFKNKVGTTQSERTSSESFFVKPVENAAPSKSSEDQKPSGKAPFDKRKWRMQKYSKKYKLQQWEEKRKKTVMREYYRQVKDEEPKLDVQKIYEEYDEDADDSTDERIQVAEFNNPVNSTQVENTESLSGKLVGKQQRIKKFLAPHEKFVKVNQEKEEKKAARLKKQAEKEAAILDYKKKKLEKYKKLNQKTRKGQPIMKHRIDMLLEEIQKSMAE